MSLALVMNQAANEWDRSMAYLNHHKRVTDNVAMKIKNHIKKHNLSDEICAWYENMEDFYSDWCEKLDGYYSKNAARDVYDEGILDGEFQRINGYGILRYVV